MTVPDDIRRDIAAVCAAADQREWLGRNAVARVLEWLDKLPQTPQPNWSAAPGYATHHGFNPYGEGRWLELTESNYTRLRGDLTATDVDWWEVAQDPSGLELPIGVDWRLTLTKRPETKETP